MVYASVSQENAVRSIARTAQQQIRNKTGMGVEVMISPSQSSGKTPEQMLTVIAMALDMEPAAFRLKTRVRHIVDLRFLGALFLRRNFPLITLHQIAALFGGQDHSSIISGISRANDLINCGDEQFVNKYNTVARTVSMWISENN